MKYIFSFVGNFFILCYFESNGNPEFRTFKISTMKNIVFKKGNKFLFVQRDEIDFIKAERNYVRIFVKDEYFVERKTLKDIEAELDNDKFIRVNRSIIINSDRIKEISYDNNYQYYVTLKCGKSLKWGKKYIGHLHSVLRSEKKPV